MQNPRAKGLSRFISAALVLAMVLAALPPFELPVFAVNETHTIAEDNVAVYIDSTYNGDTIIITGDVFSVTVNGAKDVTLVFGERTADSAKGVTIDRRHASGDNDALNGQTIQCPTNLRPNDVTGLYSVSQKLNAQGKAQTCPLLITGDSTVTATFHGVCRFYAGTNACEVTDRNVYNVRTSNGNGFAGIQVDDGSTLTIAGADDLKVFGGHQFAVTDIAKETDKDLTNDDIVTINSKQVHYDEFLRANRNVGDYQDPWNSSQGQYNNPTNSTTNSYSGGAGIGGGASLTTSNSATSTYTAGAPGNIIINGGKIEAYGGHQAAGIGGAVNSAASTGMIQINGGNVTAHGGRWAAGIGDGDSVEKTTNTAPSALLQSAQTLIEVNGGTVIAYGGVAASGIGSSDQISHSKGFGESAVRNITINLNGGTIRAYSGFPNGYQGNATIDEAPAAIGVGVDTNAPANSLYVSSEADLRCAGFGYYSLSENGVDPDAVPTISVDSDGYLLMLRTSEDGKSNSDQFHSAKTRTFTLYSPIKVEFDGQICTVYVDQQHNTRYLVNNAGTVYEESTTGTSAFGTHWKNVESGALPSTLTLYINAETVDGADSDYYDKNFPASTVLETVEMPYYFRSIALTLPHPAEYGGIYALGVPTNGIDNKYLTGSSSKPPEFDQISLTVEATQQGTQSGWIDFPSGHNMQKDNTAAPLIDLDVDGNATIDGLIGDGFLPKAYAYTVYVEPSTTKVNLYFAFEQQKVNGENIAHKIELDNKVLRNGTTGDTEFNETITLTGTETVVRVKKTDGGYTLGTISYKITIIKKGEIALDVNALGKTYDGQPVIADIAGAKQYPLKYTAEDYPQTPNTVTVSPEEQVYSYTNQKVYISYRSLIIFTTYYAAKLNYQLYVVPNGDNIYYFLTFDERESANSESLEGTYGSQKYVTGWQVTKNGNSYSNPGRITANPASITDTAKYPWVANNGYNWITEKTATLARANGTNLTLNLSDTGATLQNNNNIGTLLTIGNPGSNGSGNGVNITSAQAKEKAESAIANGETSGSYPYEVSTTTGVQQTITVGKFSWASGTDSKPSTETINYKISGTTTYTALGQWVIVAKPDTSKAPVPVELSAEDLKKVIYRYYAADDLDTPIITTLTGGDGPVNAGNYFVEATLTTQTYNAKSDKVPFKIDKRPLKVLRIENWLLYVSEAPDGDTLDIDDPGYIELDDIVPADNDGEKVKFVPERVYYDDPGIPSLAVNYHPEKIVLEGELGGNQAKNYVLDYTDSEQIRVYGQIAYKIDGAIFRMSNTSDAKWRKYYPVNSDNPVNKATADYHSPAYGEGDNITYLAHAEYIRARTVNAGEDGARYCIDIEYGAMSFGFYRSAWDVNDLEYYKLTDSQWVGMDGSNNKLTIINRSNRAISYTLSLKRASGVSGAKIGFEIKPANDLSGGTVLVGLTDDKDDTATGSAKRVEAATAGSGPGIKGAAATDSCYLIMSGIPQFAENVLTTTGTIGILFEPAGTP